MGRILLVFVFTGFLGAVLSVEQLIQYRKDPQCHKFRNAKIMLPVFIMIGVISVIPVVTKLL